MAKLSSYKSLFLSMSVASVVSLVYISLQKQIPAWFTVDETLQALLVELVPFVGVANLTMQFGMTSWSLIGAQGKYKLATYTSLISSWGATLPLAAIFVYGFNFDLQGLTSAVVIGYVSTGAALSYVLLCTDWEKVTRKIQEHNTDIASGEEENEEDAVEEVYASLKTRSQAAKSSARRNIRLLSMPPGHDSGLVLGNDCKRGGTYVLAVRQSSFFWGVIHPGDCVLGVNGQDVTKLQSMEVASMLKDTKKQGCDIAVSSPYSHQFEYDDDEEEEGSKVNSDRRGIIL